jgi:competence protein ComEC
MLYLGGIMLTSLIASLATAPFALYHFNRVAVAGLLANMIAVPLTGLWIMPWAIGAFLLMPFGLEEAALAPMGKGIELVMAVARETASLDFSVVHLPAMPIYGLILVSLGGLWLCLWQRRWRLLGIAPILAGLLTVPLERQPEIIVDSGGKLFAVTDSGGAIHLSSKTKAKFTAGNWVRRAGFELSRAGSFGQSRPIPDLNLHCDDVGCIMSKHRQRIALVTEEAALREDCRLADIVVSATPVPWACPSAIAVIDRFDLWRNGAHAIWLTGGKPIVKSVNGERGDRPWVLRPSKAD